MAAEPTIRHGTTEDYAIVSQLLSELDAYHVRILPDAFQPFDEPQWQRERIDQFIGQDDAVALLAEIDTDIVGLATILITEQANAPMLRRVRRARVDNLIVQQAYQGMGIGKALLDQSAQWARSRGVESIEITVWHDNGPGISFFTAQGFTPRCQRMEWKLGEAP